MTKEQKLDAIYEAMADKTLSQWCIVLYDEMPHLVWDMILTSDDEIAELEPIESIIESEWYDIIGHPVRIGDVLDWYNENNPEHLWCGNGKINWEVICREWSNLRLPINEQSESCISFVYSLIQK